jgi:hypothetical protein
MKQKSPKKAPALFMLLTAWCRHLYTSSLCTVARNEDAELGEAAVRMAVMAQAFDEARPSKLQPPLLDICVQ